MNENEQPHELYPADIVGTIKCLRCDQDLTKSSKKRNGPCPGPPPGKAKA